MNYLLDDVHCPDDVVAGDQITKAKRHELFGHVNGGANSKQCEHFQRRKIIQGTGLACPSTSARINLRTSQLIDYLPHPNKKTDGFDYSEDFDGVQCWNGKRIYINMKCIADTGGHQIRSLREVYWFVQGQLKVLQNEPHLYFANILDGDIAHASFPKFEYTASLPEYENVRHRLYIGDLKGYFDWFKTLGF